MKEPRGQYDNLPSFGAKDTDHRSERPPSLGHSNDLDLVVEVSDLMEVLRRRASSNLNIIFVGHAPVLPVSVHTQILLGLDGQVILKGPE